MHPTPSKPPGSIPHYSTSETIRQRKAQYCRFADSQDWSSFRSLFLDNAKATYTDPHGLVLRENKVPLSFENIEDFIDYFAVAFEKQQTMHMVSGGELNAVSEDEVQAVWPCVYHAGSKGVIGGWSGNGGGNYHETWKKVDGEWLIADLRFVRTYWKVQMGRLD